MAPGFDLEVNDSALEHLLQSKISGGVSALVSGGEGGAWCSKSQVGLGLLGAGYL